MTVLATLLVVVAMPSSQAQTSTTPPTPAGLPKAAEAWQPYVGQSTCDPVAKPGVRAFSNLLLKTYPATSSLGIVRDCGIGGQSEHKEGRAFDWGVPSSKPEAVANAKSLLGWLLATDANGNKAAMARRLGVMYMVYDQQIWRSYAADKGWQAYTGANPHTDHVHFSFGWNGAKQVTSYWDGTVAPVDYGPSATAPAGKPPRGQVDVLTASSTRIRLAGWAVDEDTPAPVNVRVTAPGYTRLFTADAYRPDVGSAFPGAGDYHGFDVSLQDLPDGELSVCVTAVNAAGTGGADTELDCRTVTVRHAADGFLDSVASGPDGTAATGWAYDPDGAAPVQVRVTAGGGTRVETTTVSRPDVQAARGTASDEVGFRVPLDDLADGTYDVCVTALNLAGTPGLDRQLGCRPVTVRHQPFGMADAVRPAAGGARVYGWAIDADTPDPVGVAITVDGRAHTTIPAGSPRPDVGRAFGLGDNRGFDAPVDLSAYPEGRRRLCLTVRNVGLGADRALGCADVDVRHQPFGSIDLVRSGPGVRVVGWAVEPDVADPARLRVTVGGVATEVVADGSRPDVGRAIPAYGGRVGFDAQVRTPDTEGRYPLCVDVLNRGPGTDQRLGCVDVDVRHTAFGSFDALQATDDRGIIVYGWAIDPDTADTVPVHVWIDGRFAGQIMAGRERLDIGRAFPSYGPMRGFADPVVGTFAPGDRRVCVSAINQGQGGAHPLLACRTVTVR